MLVSHPKGTGVGAPGNFCVNPDRRSWRTSRIANPLSEQYASGVHDKEFMRPAAF